MCWGPEGYHAGEKALQSAHMLNSVCCAARYVSVIEAGYQAAKTKHEEDWYNQQADRLGRRVQPLMQHWCSAYKVGHCSGVQSSLCLQKFPLLATVRQETLYACLSA